MSDVCKKMKTNLSDDDCAENANARENAAVIAIRRVGES